MIDICAQRQGSQSLSWNTALWLAVMAFLVSSCATGGFNAAQKTAQLRVGMSPGEVIALIGPPKSSEYVAGKHIATYWLHQEWRGNVPFDLVFSGQPERLESWRENQEKFASSQAQLESIATALQQSGVGGGSGQAAAAGPNDAELQRQIAGLWWGYAGSTERSIGLCADGRYYDSTESSYSGSSYDSLGNQTLAWGQAGQSGGQGRWTISGTGDSGVINVVYGNGNSRDLNYRQINDPGCLNIDGNMLCRKSAACQ